jgi:5-methylcytosine-specific restriction endonuclease McrA
MAPKPYSMLHREILERDGWRCQMCGCSKNLDVHHMRRRSALGDDAETNLITLCRDCHKLQDGAADGCPPIDTRHLESNSHRRHD